MGGGSWSASAYRSHTGTKIATGSTFATSATTAAAPRSARKAHDVLDPKKVAGPSSPLAGKIVREARDSDEHPDSLNIAVLFDVTGSMGGVPRFLQTKLAELFGLILRKGYVTDPQLLVGGYGDAEVDAVPLQVGQYESDNRADETLDHMYLEGGGGGNRGESAHFAWYYLAKHSVADAWEKRGKKGYLITIGDEVPLSVLRRSDVERFIGPDHGLQEDLTREDVVKLAQEKFEVYHIIIQTGADVYQDSLNVYSKLLGKDHVIVLQDEEAVAETIAVLIGLAEGAIDSLADAMDDLDDVGSTDHAKAEVSKALAKFSGTTKGSVVTATAPADLVASEGAARL